MIADASALQTYCDAIAAGSGPVALDAERASGYRYSQRAYLVQVRREGAGTGLIDPIGFDGLAPLDAAIGESEWILHAATQDLVCLAEIGLTPRRLFDTELAGRLLNLPRVGLASLVEHYLDHSLAKEHSAADWSTRPLPEPWLVYAALDVEVLIELRNHIAADLDAAGKTGVGGAGLRGTALLRRPAHTSRAVATHVGHPPGPRTARARHRARGLGGPRRHRRRA